MQVIAHVKNFTILLFNPRFYSTQDSLSQCVLSMGQIAPKGLKKEKNDDCVTAGKLYRPSDRVRLKNANYAIFSGQIVRLERPIMR